MTPIGGIGIELWTMSDGLILTMFLSLTAWAWLTSWPEKHMILRCLSLMLLMVTFSRELLTIATRIHGYMPSMLSLLVFLPFLSLHSAAQDLPLKQEKEINPL